MNFKFSKEKIFVAVAIVILAAIGFFKSSSDNLENNQIDKIEDNNSSETTKNESNSTDKKEDDSVKMCHIDGCVNKPGVYSFKKDDRLKDIIQMAGGLTKEADTKSVNLAMKLKDEMKIHIPSEKEVKDVSISNNNVNNVDVKTNSSNELVNINTADSAKLETLPGIGPSKAKKIIDFREKNQFKSIEEIKNVDGIGDKTFESLKNLITVD